MRRGAFAGLTALATLCALAPAQALEGRPGSGMLVIGHRGAPVYTTESSQLSYEMAIRAGADLLEGDVVMTKDGQLVVCHDLELSRVTDVANRPIFGGKKTTRWFNGVPYEGYWVDDFTLDEVKQLRKPNGQQIMTLNELISLAGFYGASLYVEIKESEYFASLPQPMDIVGGLIATLQATGQAGRGARFWVQSDNPSDLSRVRTVTGNRTVFLTRGVSPEEIGLFPSYRQFADVLGVPTTRARRSLVAQAHAADLGIHIWTLRGSRDAYRKAASIGADGVITDFPDLGVDVRARRLLANRPADLTTKVENGNAVATWSAEPGAYYAVTFDFGDPLLAPTVWVQGGSASYPMADAKTADITVSRFDGSRMGADAFSRAGVDTSKYSAPTVATQVSSVTATVGPDGKTRITGSMQRLRGSKWVPLRNAAAWLRGRGDAVDDLRRSFRTDKKGEFSLTVQVRDDIVSGYVPQRAWRVGVTPTGSLKLSASDWIESQEGPVPTAKRNGGRAQSLPVRDVRVRG